MEFHNYMEDIVLSILMVLSFCYLKSLNLIY